METGIGRNRAAGKGAYTGTIGITLGERVAETLHFEIVNPNTDELTFVIRQGERVLIHFTMTRPEIETDFDLSTWALLDLASDVVNDALNDLEAGYDEESEQRLIAQMEAIGCTNMTHNRVIERIRMVDDIDVQRNLIALLC